MSARPIGSPRVPSEFWTRDDIRAALGARDLGVILRLFLQYSGASQTDVGASIGIEQGHVSKFVRGKRSAISIELLERVADGLSMPDECRMILGLAPVNRSLTTFVPSERALFDTTADRAAEFQEWAESTNIGSDGIVNIHDSVRHLATDYLSESPADVVRRATNLAGRVFNILKGHQWPSQTRELYLAAGRLNVLLSWISGDLGYSRSAKAHGQTAWLCADMAADNELRAWTLSVQSKNAFWARDFSTAAELAARGRTYATAGTARLFLSCQEADAWAEVGATQQATLALGGATEAQQKVDGDDAVGGLLSCDSVRYQNYAGAVLLRLGRNAEAIEMANEALAASDVVPGRQGYGTIAQVRIWAARAHIQSSDLEGAVEVLAPVFALPGGKRLETVVSRLHEVRGEISSRPELFSSRPARALSATIESY